MQYECDPKDSFVYLLERQHSFYGTLYSSDFVAAVANSSFIREAFQLLADVIATGNRSGFEEYTFQWIEQTGVFSFPESMSQVLNLVGSRKKAGKGSGSICDIGLQRPKQSIELQFKNDKYQTLLAMTTELGLHKYLKHKTFKISVLFFQ